MGQTKQVMFQDTVYGKVFGGIMLEDGSIICGCCGDIISPTLLDGSVYRVLVVYSEWVDLSKEIIGE